MTAGFPKTLGDINTRAGSLAVALRDTLRNIQNYKAVLDTLTVQNLIDLGMSSGDANVLKSAFADLADFAGLYTGGVSSHVSGTFNWREFAIQLEGVV